MSFYCQKCGGELEQLKFCAPLWVAFFKCNTCGQSYLQVADPRWIYPLLFLELGVLEKARAASDEQLEAAAAKIQTVDYKTVSIVGFEKTLLRIEE